MRILVSIIVTVALFCTTKLMAQNQTITATVTNATSNEGKIGFALYDRANFMKKAPINAKSGEIKDGKSTVIFENVPAGEYAIICYHDKNNNNKMDFAPNGMPAEDYGTSNNVVTFGPPNFDSSKFEVKDKNVSVEIRF